MWFISFSLCLSFQIQFGLVIQNNPTRWQMSWIPVDRYILVDPVPRNPDKNYCLQTTVIQFVCWWAGSQNFGSSSFANELDYETETENLNTQTEAHRIHRVSMWLYNCGYSRTQSRSHLLTWYRDNQKNHFKREKMSQNNGSWYRLWCRKTFRDRGRNFFFVVQTGLSAP